VKAFKPIEGLEVRTSAIQGRGCFTSQPIKKDTWIVEYTGLRMRAGRARFLYREHSSTYLYLLADGCTVINGIGMAALFNHCCEPNCESTEEDGRLFFFALRDIAAGEELTLDYRLGNSDEREMPCFCGAKKCRGTMYSKAEIAIRRKRARLLAKAALG